MTTEDTREQKDKSAETRKLPYSAPKLVRLGTVRELTGTQSGSLTEGPFPDAKP